MYTGYRLVLSVCVSVTTLVATAATVNPVIQRLAYDIQKIFVIGYMYKCQNIRMAGARIVFE